MQFTRRATFHVTKFRLDGSDASCGRFRSQLKSTALRFHVQLQSPPDSSDATLRLTLHNSRRGPRVNTASKHEFQCDFDDFSSAVSLQAEKTGRAPGLSRNFANVTYAPSAAVLFARGSARLYPEIPLISSRLRASAETRTVAGARRRSLPATLLLPRNEFRADFVPNVPSRLITALARATL